MKHRYNAFALLDVILALAILAISMVGVYRFFGGSADSQRIRQLQADINNISESYTVFLGQKPLGGQSLINSSGQLDSEFLKSIPIATSHLTSPTKSTSFLLTQLTVGKKGFAQVGFADVPSKSSPGVNYLIFGLQANYQQTVEMIKSMNNSFGVFVGAGVVPFSQATIHNALPTKKDHTTRYSLYLTSPITDRQDDIGGDFTAPGSVTSDE